MRHMSETREEYNTYDSTNTWPLYRGTKFKIFQNTIVANIWTMFL